MIYPIVMSGGSGTRMWPLSRKATPKQYLALVGETSLFQDTILRVDAQNDTLDFAPTSIICGLHHLEQVRLQMAAIDKTPNAIILEPEGRNTAVVAAVAAAHVKAQDPNGLVLLLPADHHIERNDAFLNSVKQGTEAAQSGHLVTLGIQPTGPETGYGYIQQGSALTENCFKVEAFHEKPTASVAQSYLDTGGFYWNAGIFLFSAQAMLDELQKHAPDILESGVEAYQQAARSGVDCHLNPDIFAACRSESIDYAVMEKTERSAVVAPVDVGWSDIGSWSALSDLMRDNGPDNRTEGDVILLDSEASYVRSEDMLVAGIGLENMIVVAADGVVLIMPANRSQDVKKIVAELKEKARSDLL